MSARQAEQAKKKDVAKEATPAAEDVCPLCECWRCRCGESVSGGGR